MPSNLIQSHLGEIFAILTAICWVISANCFEWSGKRIGSLVVNLLRLSLAVVLLGLICWIRRGTFFPIDAPRHVWIWITISGFFGFFLCDMCLFRAFVLAGARRSMLMLSLAPCFAAILDFINNKPLSLQMLLGMVMTIAGVMWVIRQRSSLSESPHSRRELRIGAFLGLAAAILQALGATTANIGLDLGKGVTYDPMAATFIRASAGALSFAIILVVTGRTSKIIAGVNDRSAMAILSIGAIFGPVIGVTLFLASLATVQPSVTQTILATMPILTIPIAHYIHKEHITLSAILGTLLSIAGVIVLCWK